MRPSDVHEEMNISSHKSLPQVRILTVHLPKVHFKIILPSIPQAVSSNQSCYMQTYTSRIDTCHVSHWSEPHIQSE
jgi:hypothetical protein